VETGETGGAVSSHSYPLERGGGGGIDMLEEKKRKEEGITKDKAERSRGFAAHRACHLLEPF